jgi:thiol-disulfide isomerase/thioredoxin
MAKTASTMQPLGTAVPPFCLPDWRKAPPQEVRHTDFVGQPLLVMFICNHCPYVQHLQESLAEFGRTYQARGLAVVAINANDTQAYPDDSPQRMQELSRTLDLQFAYLFDATQSVARAFGAACTPDFFLFSDQGRLIYRGQYDGSRPGNGVAVDGADLRAAAEAALLGQTPKVAQQPSLGCNIKWRN